jgi:hypothetical protein
MPIVVYHCLALVYTLSRRTILCPSVRLHVESWNVPWCKRSQSLIELHWSVINSPVSGSRCSNQLIPRFPPKYLPRNHHRLHSSYHTAVYIGDKGNPVSCCSVIDKQIAIWRVTICQHNIIATHGEHLLTACYRQCRPHHQIVRRNNRSHYCMQLLCWYVTYMKIDNRIVWGYFKLELYYVCTIECIPNAEWYVGQHIDFAAFGRLVFSSV